MVPASTDRTASLQAYPNLTAAAKMIGVSASTLSRRDDLVSEPRGDRDRVLRPAEVLRLTSIYRQRSLNDVAQDLIDHARNASSEDADRVEKEVEAFFESRANSDNRRDEFLALARRLLPQSLYSEVEATVSDQDVTLPDALIGYPPVRES
jgi:hypothetical protein